MPLPSTPQPSAPAGSSVSTRPITQRALLQRINRVLAKEAQAVRICPVNSRWISTLGRYYMSDSTTGLVGWLADNGDQLEAYARNLGVVADS